MNKDSVKRLLAVSLVVFMIGGLSACTTAREQVSERTVIEDEGQQEDVGALGTDTTDMAERPVAQTDQTDTGMRERTMVTTTDVSDIENLQTGQPASYYTDQFRRMGYQVQSTNRQGDRVIHTLLKGNERVQVTLNRASGQDRIQSIDARPITGATTTAAGNIPQRIQQLQTGKRPVEYIPMLDEMGTVTEYRLQRDRAIVNMEANNRRYGVTLNLDPNRQTVNRIQVNPSRGT